MEYGILVLRTILIYVVIFAVMRLMGKREIGKLSVVDLVISIMIAEIGVFVIEDTGKPLGEGLIPILTLVALQITLALVSLRNQTLRTWFEGRPSILIQNGRMNREEMRKQRYSLDDLLVQLRQNRVMDVADVEFAILETSGKLTVVEKDKKTEEAPGPKADYKLQSLPVVVIMDGKVQEEGLAKLGQTRFWLKNRLQAEGVQDVKDVFFCSIDYKGRLFIDRKDK
ncbi:DUF421 domain-containing protein [Paenibacillus aurantius]|uniref:DUF421 domain-containing protein n=1 Tax=Paenibacillus aurantius TaxID=2918900 RepID=A0AA96RGZ7_9BACL|nr:DUF421 domain-containing protein [Paenibacillus aurantius]WNQ13001.1 DUF421 domain-containing protein [Paenibacillus aurantius]